ncbi:MAG: flavodoxin [Oscillospiraceae bacterium]|nr:flavodoxin [Oscillospiraceae bacterium]
MKIAVRYYSKGGNTKKLAEAIGEAVGEKAQTTDVKLKEDVDILFLGSSVYAAGIDKSVKEFIKGIDVKVGKVVNFSTAAILKSTYKQVSKLLLEKGIAIDEREFACRGSFAMMHKGKPDAEDCKAAADFAKKMIS